jgi:hypothetical protein
MPITVKYGKAVNHATGIRYLNKIIITKNQYIAMKKIIFLILVYFLTAQVSIAEEYYFHKFNMGQFVSWMQSVKIPEYILTQTEQEGSEEVYTIEYSAMFANGNEMINARIGGPDVFNQYEDLTAYKVVGPYYLDGFPAVYVYNKRLTRPSNMTYMMIQMPKLDATFSIVALTRKRLTQEDLEKYFSCFGLERVELNEIISWPDDIPIGIRLRGNIEEITKVDTDNSVVKAEYLVKVKKSKEFLDDLKKFYEDMKGWLDLQTYMDITLICKTSDNFEKLYNMKDGEIIEFSYYVK